MPATTDSTRQSFGQYPNSSFEPPAALAERLDKMAPLQRSYVLNNLAIHLDEAADERSVHRLIRLAQEGFPRLKAERTLDVPQSSLDYRYYFRATLRARDLAGALHLARARRGLSHLTDWLASGVLAGLLPNLPSDSKLWEQIQRAVKALQPATLRIERLTELHQPGLDSAKYSWIREQFDRDAVAGRDSAQRAFLGAVAAHERGAIQYVLRGATRAQVDDRLIGAILTHLADLCEGTTTPVNKALAEIGALARDHAEALVTAADTLAEMSDRVMAVEGLSALEAVLPESDDSPRGILCAAAVSHGWAAHCEFAKAEAMARKCLELIPPEVSDTAIRMLYAKTYVDAAGRLALAAAPFASLWPRASRLAEELAARGSALSHKSATLVHFLRITPWIANSRVRTAWLDKTLIGVREFIAMDLDNGLTDPLDLAISLGRTLRAKSARQQFCEPILDAIMDVTKDIDRVLSGPDDMKPVMNLIRTAVVVSSSIESNEEGLYALFLKLLPALCHSSHISVHVLGLETFFKLTSGEPSEEAAAILEPTLVQILTGKDNVTVYGLASGILDRAEHVWCGQNREMRTALARAVLNTAVRTKQSALLELFQPRLADWIKSAEPHERDWYLVSWAASMIALGRGDEGRQVLSILREPRRDTRLMMARVFLEFGSPSETAALLEREIPEMTDIRNANGLEATLEAARLLVLANGDARSRDFLFGVALQYRAAKAEVDDDVEVALLNGFRALRDDEIIHKLLSRAETELLQSSDVDSPMAARWYLTLALSASGEIRAAKRVWTQISGWKEQCRSANVRNRLIEVLEKEERAGPADLEQLEQAVKSVRNPRDRQTAMLRICRTLRTAGPTMLPGLIDIILNGALGLAPSTLDTILAAFCETLAECPIGKLAGRTAERVMSLVDCRGLPERSGDPESVLKPIFRLVGSRSNDSDNALRSLLRRLTHPYASGFEAALFAQAIDLLDDFPLALSLSDQVADGGCRWLFLNAVGNASLKTGDVSVVDAVLMELISRFDQANGDRDGGDATLGSLYRPSLPIASHGVIAAIEERIRLRQPPHLAASIVRWASNLAATPLQSLCEATLLELWNDLDRFAARPDDLDSLGAFLALELRGGIRPGFEQFARIVEWAAAMPLVTNEDWRHTAFTRILKATEGLGAECRDAVQKLTLGRAFDALKGYKFGLENLVSGLVFLPLTIETAEWTIAAWLDCARNTARADLDSLVDLLVRNLEYKADAANTPAVEAFLRHLDQVPGYPSALKRQAAARAACECSDARLQGRLAEFLLRDYEINGLSGLEQWDLAFLANMPFEWWVEQSTRIELGRVSPSVLLNWMERVIRKSPDSAWWATVLACEWLSRSDPNGIADFWFDLCTLPSLPLDNRKLLFEALKVFRPEEKNP